ncbi:TniQ family protein [Gordonia sp. HY442]|nr:TniQ family protein [Gordonia zhenghanii]MCF8604281.1 TniQ family protein [Gordonia zhenghanii]
MLPARIAIDPRESLDSYLERIALVNDLTTRNLVRMLKEDRDGSSPSTAFMLVRPSDDLVGRITSLTGLSAAAVENSTLMRYDGGTPLTLDGFDPLDRASYRAIVCQGWFPRHGTQLCPLCLSHDGIWQLSWKLPVSTVCPDHGVYLVAECSSCGNRFRTRHYSPLRPLIDEHQPCGNPLGFSAACRHSILREKPTPASGGAMQTATRVTAAIQGEETSVLNAVLAPPAYLAEVRNLTTLLLHLASRARAQESVDWAGELQAEAAGRTTELRGPRWGIQPPTSAVVRGQALAEADGILASPEIADAVARLAEWFDLISDVPEGPRGWIVNRTAPSPVLGRLVMQVLSARRHVGLQIDHHDALTNLPLSAIPQLLDEHTYRRHFGGMLTTQESTGRLYASLCIARAQRPGSTWSAAAASISLDPDIGRRTARAASTRLTASPREIADAANMAAKELSHRRDYRALERQVIKLANTPDTWFADWARSASPRRRAVALPYAVTWMWCEAAQGVLDTSPAWPPPVTRQSKAAYRVFRDTLPEELVRALGELANKCSN